MQHWQHAGPLRTWVDLDCTEGASQGGLEVRVEHVALVVVATLGILGLYVGEVQVACKWTVVNCEDNRQVDSGLL